MIHGILHAGSGLGNQLHRYVATRVLSLDEGYDFSIVAPENFKGKSFMNPYMGVQPSLPYIIEYPAGKVVPVFEPEEHLSYFEEKTPYYNPEFNFVKDDTIIDGEFQDERYFERHLAKIDEWLKVEPLNMPNDLCVIGFRGGEFTIFPDLFLTPEYWEAGIAMMTAINPKMKFEVHTDDPITAQRFFPDYKVIHDIGINWRSMRYARYAIIANSSFYIFPRLLSKGYTIAPRYWARRNTREWSMPQNHYKSFKYI